MNIVTAPPYTKEKVLEVLQSFDQEGKTVRADRNTIKIFEVDGEAWNIKSFKIPNIINKYAYRYIRKSKAQRSFEHAQYLLKRNIRTPKPIAYAENYADGALERSFYISIHEAYQFTFMKLFEDKQWPDRELILKQFTDFTFKLHEAGIDFLDHNHGNTLITKIGEGQYDFSLVDLNRMNFGKLSLNDRIKNFQKLHLTRDMADIIGKRYAQLVHQDAQKLQDAIWQAHTSFTQNRIKNKRLKRKLGL